jgi:hypothetical protein
MRSLGQRDFGSQCRTGVEGTMCPPTSNGHAGSDPPAWFHAEATSIKLNLVVKATAVLDAYAESHPDVLGQWWDDILSCLPMRHEQRAQSGKNVPDEPRTHSETDKSMLVRLRAPLGLCAFVRFWACAPLCASRPVRLCVPRPVRVCAPQPARLHAPRPERLLAPLCLCASACAPLWG